MEENSQLTKKKVRKLNLKKERKSPERAEESWQSQFAE